MWSERAFYIRSAGYEKKQMCETVISFILQEE